MTKSILVFLLLLCNISLFAGTNRWEINKDHSEILFQIPYLKLTSLTGRFTQFSGEVYFPNEADPIPSKIQIHINPNSIFTGNKLRDGHLKSAHFFDPRKYPMISFFSDKISSLNRDSYRARGELHIKGVSKPITIDYQLTNEVTDTWNKRSRFISFQFKINRQDFNLNWNKSLKGGEVLVGDNVTVSGIFQLQPQTGMTPSSLHLIPNTKAGELRDKYRLGNIGTEDYRQALKPPKIQKVDRPRTLVTDSSVKPSHTKSISPTPALASRGDFRNNERDFSLQWWIALLVLGGLAFFGTIIIAIKSKEFLDKTFSQYSEINLWGVLSDLPILLIVFLYAVSMWQVGWGQ